MSYDFHLLQPRADGDIREYARLEMDDGDFAPVDPKKEAMKLRIAQALAARFPAFEASRVGYEANAPSRLRCLELNDMSAESLGIQIQLFDDEAFVTVPYWHAGAKAQACFRQIWDAMRVICGEAGYAVFDPQLDRALEDGEDIDAALADYLKTMAHIARDPAFGGRAARRPWWKFW
jgi:hypothetical protein